MLPTAATDFYATQQRVNTTAKNEIARLWSGMGDDFDVSWRRIGPAVLAVLVEAQRTMVDEAQTYLPTVLSETRIPNRPTADFRPNSLVGIASDGRPLDTLAYGSIVKAKVATTEGADTQAALDTGGGWLELMAKLQIADAARQAVGVLIATRPNLGGTVRVLNPPSCQRCAILAGRFYRWSKGFDRHPKCDCMNTPVPSEQYAKAEGFISDPMDAYRAGEIRDLTEAQRFALDNGADIGQVVNAYRGMSTTATETAKSVRLRQKLAARSPRPTVPTGQPDLMAFMGTSRRPSTTDLIIPTPEGIYQEAKGDRNEAIRLLREWGYLT